MAVGMGGVMLFFQVFVPLLLVSTVSSSEKKVFKKRGGSIVLQAEQVTGVTSIIWKHNKDKAAEWFKGDNEPTYYNIFKDVTTLDNQTWALTISNLQPHFSGKYSAEVNNKDPTQFVNLTVLEQVEKPTITMDCLGINCTLTCKGKTDGSTEYTWTNDIGGKWSGSELTVKMTDDDVVYTCSISNQASSASSNPGTVKKYVPPPSVAGTGGIIGVIIGVIIAGFTIYAGICLLVFKKRQEHKEPVADEENQEKPNTVTPPGPPGEHKSPEAVPLMPSVTVTEHKETPGDEGKQETTNTGNILNALKTMTCRDRCRIFIPCIKVTSPVPSGEDKDPKAIPLRQSVTENNEAHGGKESPEKTNTEVIKQTEANTDQLHEGELTGNGAGPTADGENNEAHGGKESPEKTNTGDEKLPKADTDQLHEEKLGEPVETSTADGENNEAHGGKESPEKTNTENNEAHGGKESPEKTNTEVMKQTEANTGPLHEGELTGNGAGPTADGEHNEAHGGKESPEKTNTDDNKPPEANTDAVHEGKLTENDPGSTADGVDKERGGVEEKKQLLNTDDNKPPEANTDAVHEEELTENDPGSTADGDPTSEVSKL